mmetsp:Transcript_19239/g.34276  ORF Transcript_19239/g.34276 Transcript_19239/m.34276 type:complete len:207 (+) Transcript_19239:915-1535(+)
MFLGQLQTGGLLPSAPSPGLDGAPALGCSSSAKDSRGTSLQSISRVEPRPAQIARHSLSARRSWLVRSQTGLKILGHLQLLLGTGGVAIGRRGGEGGDGVVASGGNSLQRMNWDGVAPAQRAMHSFDARVSRVSRSQTGSRFLGQRQRGAPFCCSCGRDSSGCVAIWLGVSTREAQGVQREASRPLHLARQALRATTRPVFRSQMG